MASSIYGIVFNIQDQLSGGIRKISAQMDALNSSQRKLTEVQQMYNNVLGKSSKNIGDLRAAIELLKEEREIVSITDIERIRLINREIKNYEGQVRKLEGLNGGPLKKSLSFLSDAIPGVSVLTNPILAASAALTVAGKSSMEFDKGMAEVNATAQLSAPGLNDLKEKMKLLSMEKGVSLTEVPAGLNKLVSITNDVGLSIKSMSVAADVSKAGFVSLDVAATTLGQTMGALGSKDANHIADVLFAAQREGAVTFNELANNLPRLIPTAKGLGFAFEEVAGTFAYMTSKGLQAADAGTLMSNVFTAIGRPEIRDGLRDYGVELSNTDGSMKSLTAVMTELNKAMAGMNTDEQLNFLKEIGLNDVQAREGIRILTGDIVKLHDKVKEVTGSSGALQRALGFVGSTSYDLQGAFSVMQVLLVDIGHIVAYVAIPPLVALAFIFKGLRMVFPFIAFYIGLMATNWAFHNATLIRTSTVTAWNTTLTWAQASANWGVVTSLRAMTAALFQVPIIGWILAIIAFIGTMVILAAKWDGFRYALLACWEVLKNIGSIIFMLSTGNFKGAQILIETTYTSARNKFIKDGEAEKETDPAKMAAAAQASANGLATDGAGGNAATEQQVQQLSSNTTGGGARATSIVINELKLLENMNVHAANLTESADKVGDVMASTMLRVLNGVTLSIR